MNALYLGQGAGEQRLNAVHAKTVREIPERVLAGHADSQRALTRVAARGGTRDQSSRNSCRVRGIRRKFLTH